AGGGAVFALSGPVLSLAENLPLLAGASWLPWALAFGLEAGRRGRRTATLAAAMAIALAAVAGDLQGATWAGVLVIAVAAIWRRGSLALAPLGAVALAAAL